MAIVGVVISYHLQIREGKDLRWLSWDACIESVYKLLSSIFTYCRDSPDPTAKGLFKQMATYEFVACLSLMRDVLPLLSRLSKTFQADDVDISVVRPAVQVGPRLLC